MMDEPVQTFDNVWDALAKTREEAASMTLRSDLMTAERNVVESWQKTLSQAVLRLGVTQPRLNDLLRGRINRFSLDALIELAQRAGLTVNLEIHQTAA